MMAVETSLKVPTETIYVAAQRYQLTPALISCGTQGLSDHLRKFYDQVEVKDRDWVKLGFWERYPTFGRLPSGEMVRIKEIVRPYYLRPQGQLLDMFSVSPGSETSYFFNIGGSSNIVEGVIEWEEEDLVSSDYPLYSVMWNELPNPVEGVILRRSVTLLKGDKWAQIPETDRQRMGNGLISWSIKCDYRNAEWFNLSGVTFSNHGGVLLYVEDKEQREIELAHFVGGVMDVLYTEGQGPTSLFVSS